MQPDCVVKQEEQREDCGGNILGRNYTTEHGDRQHRSWLCCGGGWGNFPRHSIFLPVNPRLAQFRRYAFFYRLILKFESLTWSEFNTQQLSRNITTKHLNENMFTFSVVNNLSQLLLWRPQMFDRRHIDFLTGIDFLFPALQDLYLSIACHWCCWRCNNTATYSFFLFY